PMTPIAGPSRLINSSGPTDKPSRPVLQGRTWTSLILPSSSRLCLRQISGRSEMAALLHIT
ncbi:hypothetical protein MK280_04110, partial [Myxococcota bacterium]|nr:hypothetical protein [Myxococcota bacterium]